MGISIFPSTAAEFVSNNFVIDMNDSTNNTADTGGVKQAGPYSISFSSGDTSFDVYFVDSEGNSVGYSNNTSIVASGLFTTVVILGVAQDEVVSFLYQGSVNNADGEGDEPGAGAYLESISPSDLPTIDDTATVIGGNFGADTEIFFDSGATSLAAKNITVNNSTELIVTRPDNLDAGLDPWTLRAVTTGVPEPTGTNANLLVDGVTAGAVPSWVTTSPLASGTINSAYSDTLEATDADGAVTYSITTGSLPTGLSLDSSTGVISGTPTAGGETFTVTASDDGGNQATREFTIPIQLATGGTVTSGGGFVYHTFVTSGDFEPLVDIPSAEYLVVAGGGAGGDNAAGGGGAGGLLNGTANLTAGTIAVAVGAGGVVSGINDPAADGSNSSFGTIATSIGGGGGSRQQTNGRDGGSGGGGGDEDFGGTTLGGSGTAGQGNDGGDGIDREYPGGGGGAGFPGDDGISANAPINGGDGLEFADFASATSTGDSGFYAGGGGAGGDSNGIGGAGGGGDDGVSGTNATGGGGGGQGDGGSGIVIVRY